MQFPWDDVTVQLPKELQALWGRACAGEHRVDLKKLLEEPNRFAELPARAPENNLLPEQHKRSDAS